MELRHIRYFLVLAEELNFSRAAARLNMAQPPLSRQIKELEEEIGTPLFYRTKRQVELTHAGRIFLNKAYQILDDVEQACISTRLSSTGKIGEFRIGFNGAIQDLIPTLQRYRKQFPQVDIVLHHMSSTEQIEALNEKQIDIAIVSVPIRDHKIQTSPLQKVRFKAALPENHPLTVKPNLYLRDLENETFIMTSRSAGKLYYSTVMNVFQDAGFTPKIAIQAHDLQTVLALVAGGMGVTLTPSLTNDMHGIITREIEDIHLTIEASLAWRKDHHSKILENFLDFFFKE